MGSTTTPDQTRAVPLVPGILALAVAYFITGWLGLLVALPPGNATALWPPSGIALMSLLVAGRRLWPGIFIGAFVTNVAMFPGDGVLAVVGPAMIAAGSTVEIMLAAYLVERFAGGRQVLAAPSRVPRFVLACAVAATVAATVGLLVTAGLGGAAVHAVDYWLTWWLGDVVGMLVLGALAFTGARRPDRVLEWVATLVVTLVVSELVFGRPLFVTATILPVAWAILPAIVWAAMRLDVRAVVLHTMLIHVMASWGTVDGVSHLAASGDLGLLVLDGLLVVAIITGLLLVATGEAVEAARRTLEDRVAERTRALAAAHEERLRLQQALTEAGAWQALGRLAGGVAHDFNNLLTVIRAEAEALRDHEAGGDAATTIIDASDRASGLTRQLLAVGSAPTRPARDVDATAALKGLRRLLKTVLPPGIVLEVEAVGDHRAAIDPGQLDQILLNLALNARDAIAGSGGAGTLSLRLRRVTDAASIAGVRRPRHPGPYVVVDVTDTGPGIADDVIARVFEPGYTTRPGLGHGLGLSTAAALVDAAGGALVVDSAPGRGSTFSVWLPAIEP